MLMTTANIYVIDEDAENWCLTRSSDTPSSLLPVQQPTDSTHDFDQDGTDNRGESFSVLAS